MSTTIFEAMVAELERDPEFKQAMEEARGYYRGDDPNPPTAGACQPQGPRGGAPGGQAAVMGEGEQP